MLDCHNTVALRENGGGLPGGMVAVKAQAFLKELIIQLGDATLATVYGLLNMFGSLR